MDLPGLIKVDGTDLDLIGRLADMAGESFLEEPWTKLLMEALPPTEEERRVALYQALIRCDLTYAAPIGAAYCLEDESALAIAYRKSELGDKTWSEVEDRGARFFARIILQKEEKHPFREQLKAMAPISDFTWEESYSEGKDFIHFPFLAVAKDKRGSGSFRRLMEPYLAYADENGLPCYLETYCDRSEAIYRHFGFETVKVIEDPAFDISERCMCRQPQSPS